MSEENAETNNTDRPLVSLKEFINEYEKTLTVVGVFIALGLFWKTINKDNSIPYISYLCFLITLPLLWEVWRGYNARKSSWNLVIFITLFQGIFVGTVLQMLFDYPQHLSRLFGGVGWLILIVILSMLADKGFTYLRHRDYIDAVEYINKLKALGVEQTKINEETLKSNSNRNRRDRLLDISEAGIFLAIIIISLFVWAYAQTFIDVLIYTNSEVNVEAPVSPTLPVANVPIQ